MVEQEKEKGFTVTDRRGGSQESDPASQREETRQTHDTAPREEVQQERRVPQDASPPLPDADFMTLIFSLYTHAQINLGLIPDPMSQQPAKDLIQAKYNIDILAILKEKTEGNLNQEEEQALEQMLYGLRMSYVQAR
jgi:hypothetical protein